MLVVIVLVVSLQRSSSLFVEAFDEFFGHDVVEAIISEGSLM